ncbi:MAG: hypothetical protein K2M13_02220 [Muribaculaceae bacterium]|nr:hypothetical protein [Muribaculaceae bacterium]
MAYTNPNAKVGKIFEILTILRGDLIEIFAEVTTFSPPQLWLKSVKVWLS